MLSPLLLDLETYDPKMVKLREAFPLMFPCHEVWVRSREWQNWSEERLLAPALVSPPQRKFSVAIVGTRKPSAYGIRVTEELVRRLGRYDMTVVSGGAFGIDRVAHEAALTEGLATRAWLVGPISDPSPRSHRSLFEEIEKAPGSGLIVPRHLEREDGNERRYLAHRAWLARNTWVAAEADAVVVVEAYQKSGTWQTAKDADELGKPVFVVPGPIFAATSYGTNSMMSRHYAHPVVDLGELTETLVVLARQGSYNIDKGSPQMGGPRQRGREKTERLVHR